MNFLEKYLKRTSQLQNHLCVGLDPDPLKIPDSLKSEKKPIQKFLEVIIENTFEFSCAYKPNSAFFESLGIEGLEILDNVLKKIPKDIPIILDAKRADIGNTSAHYAKACFDLLEEVDAVTLNPYMGFDSLEPFMNYSDKALFILAKTSNPGSSDFQNIRTQSGNFLYQDVIKKVTLEWAPKSKAHLGFVFGATHVQELEENLPILNKHFLLIPGVGAQGASYQSILEVMNRSDHNYFLVNASRNILYASSGHDFAKKAQESIKKICTS